MYDDWEGEKNVGEDLEERVKGYWKTGGELE